jgi:hypothetical protein
MIRSIVAVTLIASTLAACTSDYDRAEERYRMAKSAGSKAERCSAAREVTVAARAGRSANTDDELRYLSAQVEQASACDPY